MHDRFFITTIFSISVIFSIVAHDRLQDRLVHGQARNRIIVHLVSVTIVLILADLAELPHVLFGLVAYLRQSDGLLHLLLFLAHLLGLGDLVLFSDRLVLSAHIERPLRVQRHVDREVHAWHVLTRTEDALMAHTRHDFVADLNVGRLHARQHILLHPVHSRVQRVARLKVNAHKESVSFYIRVTPLLKQDGVVSRDLSRFLRSYLIVELAMHDYLLILELLLHMITRHGIGDDGPFQVKFDIGNHLFAPRIVYRYFDHSF